MAEPKNEGQIPEPGEVIDFELGLSDEEAAAELAAEDDGVEPESEVNTYG